MSARPAAPSTIRWTAASLAIAATSALGIAGVGAAPNSATAHGAVHHSSAARSGFAGGKWGDATADAVSKDSYGVHQAQNDPGSMYTVGKAIGARGLWGKKDRANFNVTGQGVGVAVLDSGVDRVPGLNGAGKVTYGPDLSIEANGPLADEDTYGHGTFMAGIIAGRGATNPSSDLPSAPANVQLGIAPDAELLAVKLATTDGSTDVSQVIAGIDWVTQHPVLPDGTPIRVINLSYGTDSRQAYLADPLAAAVENAWDHGIVVVTSAGNTGTSTGSLTDPAYDPYVIAVGATDSSEQLNGWAHDHTRAASFSNVGSARVPDLAAPGTSLVSVRNPGSFIDQNNPQGLVAGDTSGKLFRGSGTSQAAAVVSGSAALLLQMYPNLTPDQVKYALVKGAEAINNGNRAAVGAGTVNLSKALSIAQQLAAPPPAKPSPTDPGTLARAAAVQSFPKSGGQGSLDAARGDSLIVDADGNPIGGEVDVQGQPWDAAAWRAASTSLTAWSGGQWLGETWAGDGWDQSSDLASARWSSARWSSARWSSADWSSARWSSARWSSARWSSARWSSARWSSNDW